MGLSLQDLTFVAIDIETTGFKQDAEIIEIGLVKVVNNKIADRYQKLIKPVNIIPEEITLLTGISNEMVTNKPSWSEIEIEILNFIGGYVLVAHNVNFDKGFLDRNLGFNIPNLWIDTWDLAKITLPLLPSYQLSYLVNVLNIKKLLFHKAINDAEMTAAIFGLLTEELSKLSPFVLNNITNLLTDDTNGLGLILKKVQKKNVSDFWLDNKRSWEEDVQEESNIKYSFDDAEMFFTHDGILSLKFSNYEFRPQQHDMFKTIRDAFNQNYHAIIEAATGTGKSLAYLIPALLWSNEKQYRVVISTNTIALQEQLFKYDIPSIENCLGCKFRVSIVKGRNNYVCLRRFYILAKDSNVLNWQEKVFLAQIYNWLDITDTGDKEEINLNNYENELWLQISSQIETCVGGKCSFSKKCYYLKNRREAEKSNLIITNHSLLLKDIIRDNKILPQYDYLIIDEAHNLEDEALKQFSSEVNFRYLKKILNQLAKGKNNNSLYQLLYYSNEHLSEIGLANLIAAIKQEALLLSSMLDDCIRLAQSQEQSLLGELRITENERYTQWWNNFNLFLENIANYLTSLIHKINSFVCQMEAFEDFEEIYKELRFQISLLNENKDVIKNFIIGKEEEKVYWLQINKDNLILIITPFNIANILGKKLFKLKKSAILTSATLAVNSNFDHIINMYGIEKLRTLTGIFDSPFNYQTQSIICIPTDLPEPSNITDNEYINYVADSLLTLIPAISGGILILFTSYHMLNSVYKYLKREEYQLNKEILAHGSGGRRKTLIETLKKYPNKTVILGTNSFWEGIDIQGLGLTAVVIVKLPFAPPSRPVIAAKLELFEKNKQNSFYKYSLPSAILRFRQGFGRLIRSGKDWGTLIILDKRVLTKKYGVNFIKSLPKQPIITDDLNIIASRLSEWMKNKNTSSL